MLILTGSRGGVSASLAGVLALALLSAVRGRRNAVGAGFGLLGALLVVGMALFKLWRFSRRPVHGPLVLLPTIGWPCIASFWRSIADAPLFGFGDGTFQEVFPIYRDGSHLFPFGCLGQGAQQLSRAFLRGFGVPVAVLLVSLRRRYSPDVACMAALMRRNGRRPRPLCRWAAATVIVAMHAFVDFEPANTGGGLDLRRAPGRRRRAIMERKDRDRSISGWSDRRLIPRRPSRLFGAA